MKSNARTKNSSRRKQSTASQRANTGVGVVLAGALMAAMPAQALELNTGNSDVKVRWDNAASYNLGTRLQNRDALVDRASGGIFSQSNALFGDRGDIITNRVDLLSEIDLSYKDRFGARVSAAAWYDNAYGNYAASGASVARSSYVNSEFTPIVKRYYHGLSGEILDAYVSARFDLGSAPLDIRLGKHAVIWGEGLFGSTNAVSYSQSPNDSRKALANPAATAKETALATKQVSAVAQVTDEVTVAALYSFEWAPNRLPEGGTFFAAADFLFDGPNVGREPAIKGNKGDVGLSLRWKPEFMDGGTFGAYYRRFDEKQPWAAQRGAVFGTRNVYAPDVELLGVSMTKVVGGISVGGDLSYRKHMPLNSAGASADGMGARGQTLHAVVNAVKLWGDSAWFSSASLAAELGFAHLIKVTDNPAFYRTAGSPATGCATEDLMAGCSSKNFSTVGLAFTPVWQQALPGVDVSLPLFYSINFKGNGPTNAGGNEGFKAFKVGVSALAYSKHKFDLAATFYKGQSDSQRNLINGAPYNDKANLIFTYSVSF